MMEKILFITAYVPHKAAAGEKNTLKSATYRV